MKLVKYHQTLQKSGGIKMTKNQGWKNERQRHSMASKGVSTRTINSIQLKARRMKSKDIIKNIEKYLPKTDKLWEEVEKLMGRKVRYDGEIWEIDGVWDIYTVELTITGDEGTIEDVSIYDLEFLD